MTTAPFNFVVVERRPAKHGMLAFFETATLEEATAKKREWETTRFVGSCDIFVRIPNGL
jgi:hypothetical protein